VTYSDPEPPITSRVTQNESDNEHFDDHNLGSLKVILKRLSFKL